MRRQILTWEVDEFGGHPDLPVHTGITENATGALTQLLRACFELADMGEIDEDDYTDEVAQRVLGIWKRIGDARANIEMPKEET